MKAVNSFWFGSSETKFSTNQINELIKLSICSNCRLVKFFLSFIQSYVMSLKHDQDPNFSYKRKISRGLVTDWSYLIGSEWRAEYWTFSVNKYFYSFTI